VDTSRHRHAGASALLIGVLLAHPACTQTPTLQDFEQFSILADVQETDAKLRTLTDDERGACCDRSTSICIDDALASDCVGPRLQWMPGARCGESPDCAPTDRAALNVEFRRGGTSAKGSVLIFPHVEVRYNADGEVLQDTFIQITNDWNEQKVRLLTYFISEQCARLRADVVLTKKQPVYFSAATGLPFGVAPVSALAGAVQPVPGTSDKIARGAFLCLAVRDDYAQIRWNHLSGLATVVNYVEHGAWEYSPYAFQALIGDNGQAIGTPGVVRLDGVEYESGFNRLLLEFIASGSMAFSLPAAAVKHDTELTLLIQDLDLRQDVTGYPYRTKALFQIWNANEISFLGDHCVTCWSSVRLSTLGGFFLVENLGTDRGRAAIDGIPSPAVCDLDPNVPASSERALLGTAAKVLQFGMPSSAGSLMTVASATAKLLGPPPTTTRAGSTLVGTGNQSAVILYDLALPPEEGGAAGDGLIR
jgi:hypothetical protein